MSAIYVNSIKDKTNTRELASDSGSAWSWGSVPAGTIINYKFVEIGVFELSGTYTKLIRLPQGLQRKVCK